MLPFKKILCPTDFSEPSYEALKAAGELAYHFDSELCIAHVISPVPLVPAGVDPAAFNVALYEEELMTSSKRSLEEVLSHLETKEVKARLIALRGNAAEEIVRLADEENVDLIVIATRGRSGLDRLIFGSVTEKVLQLARCPVLTIPRRFLKEESAETGSEQRRTPPLDSAISKFREISDEAAVTVSKKKKAYVEIIDDQLKEWGSQIDTLMARAEKSKAEVKIMYLQQIEELKNKQESVKQKLHALKGSGDEAWEDLKGGVENALGDMKSALKRALARFKKGEQ